MEECSLAFELQGVIHRDCVRLSPGAAPWSDNLNFGALDDSSMHIVGMSRRLIVDACIEIANRHSIARFRYDPRDIFLEFISSIFSI